MDSVTLRLTGLHPATVKSACTLIQSQLYNRINVGRRK